MKENIEGTAADKVIGAIFALKNKKDGVKEANKTKEDGTIDLSSIVKKLSRNRSKTKKS